MQFVNNGPDIPDALLQAHEEGRVVFFCGAGISYPAGLPGFKGLVQQIYKLNGTECSDIELAAFEKGNFDATLELLERRLPGQRLAVRTALVQALKPKLRRKGAIDTHTALLRLARGRNDVLRLVTTNFDRVFHVAAKRTRQAFETHAAPMLPVPKNSRWNGLVYLHGLLPEKGNETALNRLVVTSGDFGSAYLTERWAARFVSELFRNYVVCFVGYSINDPILRYMMDALAADRLSGDITPQAWALGDCEPGKELQATIEWEAKGVTPILYNVSAGDYSHSALHQTLSAWADTYRDGVQGKEAIVVKHALARPQDSTPSDNFVSRMLWVLSDKSGLPAKRFADFNPVPSLDWLLESFAIERFGHADLARFGVVPGKEADAELTFSLIRRPTPYRLAPSMLLACGRATCSDWDDAMFHLARWLVRHLNDVRLVIWVAERGGRLHDSWLWLIEQGLERIASLEREGKISELDELRLYAPMCIPSPSMRTFWRLLLTGRVKSQWRDPDLFRWKSRLRRDGLTTTLRLELRELLAPKVLLKKPFSWSGDLSVASDFPENKPALDWELVLSADDVKSILRDDADESWKNNLSLLLEDFQQLLLDALDLSQELGGADDRSDRSNWDLPSIKPHWQNRGFHDWVSLIEMLRDAWMEVLSKDEAHANRIAVTWFKLPYPCFKRLAFFAASHDNVVPPKIWVNWLLKDDKWWLWASSTKREVLRLIVLQGHTLNNATQERLETAILKGPLREAYRDDLEQEEWHRIVLRSVWLYLSKLKSTGIVLGTASANRLEEISRAFPEWHIHSNESDEFSRWMSGTGDPDYDSSRDVDIAPRKRRDIVEWLSRPTPVQRPFYEDTWRDVCRTRFFSSLLALCDLAKQDLWPSARWRDALNAWAEEGAVLRSWQYAAAVVRTMPAVVLQETAHALTSWMETVSKATDHNEDVMLELCHRMLSLPLEVGAGSHIIRNGVDSYDPVSSAINHPVGHVTQTLINLWFKRKPNDDDLLPLDLAPTFAALCDVKVERFCHARVLLGANLIAFFRVDRNWTAQYLLPLFEWESSHEASALWSGFLWSPRLYQPLMASFKSQFLKSACYYNDLGEYRKQYAAFMTFAALDPSNGYSKEEFRLAFSELPQAGLEESAQALYQALGGAAEQREDYWKHRVQPFWQQVWPKSRNLATPRIAESLTRLVIAAGGQFAAAVESVKDWLLPIEHPNYVVGLLHKSGLCSRSPTEALQLLNSVIDDQRWGPQELGNCLNDIANAAPQLVQLASYIRLREYSKRRGS